MGPWSNVQSQTADLESALKHIQTSARRGAARDLVQAWLKCWSGSSLVGLNASCESRG